jgi:hypothetical protein
MNADDRKMREHCKENDVDWTKKEGLPEGSPLSIAYRRSGHRKRRKRSPSALLSPRQPAPWKLAENHSRGGIDRFVRPVHFWTLASFCNCHKNHSPLTERSFRVELGTIYEVSFVGAVNAPRLLMIIESAAGPVKG